MMIGFNPSFLRFFANRLLPFVAAPAGVASGGFWSSAGCSPSIFARLCGTGSCGGVLAGDLLFESSYVTMVESACFEGIEKGRK